MLEIMLLGLAVFGIYLVSHFAVIGIERWRGIPLGVWRTAIFFLIFLTLAIIAIELIPRLLGGASPA